MKFANITTIPKKGSLSNLENERGIFHVDVIRSILMRLVYNDKYSVVDKNMSDCQIEQECEKLEYGYKYKESLHVGLLGLVDDTIAITEAGYKAHIMNAFLNVKTAEKICNGKMSKPSYFTLRQVTLS